MVSHGFDGEKIKAILGDEGRFEEFDMALSKIYIDRLFEEKYGRLAETNVHRIAELFADEHMNGFSQLVFPNEISKGTQNDIIDAARNDHHIFIAATINFLNEHPEIKTEVCIKDFEGRRVLLLKKLLSMITPDQVEALVETYWNIKKRYTEDMIDIFVHPDDPKYKIERDGKEMRMLDYFKQRIAQGDILME